MGLGAAYQPTRIKTITTFQMCLIFALVCSQKFLSYILHFARQQGLYVVINLLALFQIGWNQFKPIESAKVLLREALNCEKKKIFL